MLYHLLGQVICPQIFNATLVMYLHLFQSSISLVLYFVGPRGALKEPISTHTSF